MKYGRQVLTLCLLLIIIAGIQFTYTHSYCEDHELELNLTIDIVLMNITLAPKHLSALRELLHNTFYSYISENSKVRPLVKYKVRYNIIIAPKTMVSKLNRYMRKVASKGPLPPYIEEYFRYVHPNVNPIYSLYVDAISVEKWLFREVTKYLGRRFTIKLVLISIPWIKEPRVYRIQTHTGEYCGFCAFGGNYPLYFIDLSVVPKPYPEPEYALSMYGVRINYTTFKPVWDLSPENLVKVIAKYIENFVRYIIVGDYVFEPKYSELYYLKIIVLDLNSGKGLDIGRSIDIMYLYRLLKGLTPYTEWIIDIEVAKPGAELVREILKNSSTINNWLVLEVDHVVETLHRYGILNYTYRWNCTYIPCIIITTPQPNYLTYNFRLNFSAAATSYGIVSSYPGYRHRIEKEGIEVVIAHEVGHILGLSHPFEKLIGGELKFNWLYDWVISPMSYSPLIAAWTSDVFVFDSLKLCNIRYYDLGIKIKSLMRRLESLDKDLYMVLLNRYRKCLEMLRNGMCICNSSIDGARCLLSLYRVLRLILGERGFIYITETHTVTYTKILTKTSIRTQYMTIYKTTTITHTIRTSRETSMVKILAFAIIILVAVGLVIAFVAAKHIKSKH